MILKVPKGEDPYKVIGNHIRDNVKVIEDMIVTIEINGSRMNELFEAYPTEEGYFIWESDWWEGEEDVALIDFFPVSEACNPKTSITERCNGKTALIEAISSVINDTTALDPIPIEWIKEWTNKHPELVSETVFELLGWMIEDWEKEQEK